MDAKTAAMRIFEQAQGRREDLGLPLIDKMIVGVATCGPSLKSWIECDSYEHDAETEGNVDGEAIYGRIRDECMAAMDPAGYDSICYEIFDIYCHYPAGVSIRSHELVIRPEE